MGEGEGTLDAACEVAGCRLGLVHREERWLVGRSVGVFERGLRAAEESLTWRAWVGFTGRVHG